MAARRRATALDDAVANGRGVERPFQCHMHDDSHASASVNVEKGVWCCYACGASGRVDRKGSTLTKDMRRTMELLDGTTRPQHYPPEWLDVFDAAGTHPYWIKRFGAQTCRKWRLGIDLLTGDPTYPLWDEYGNVLGVVRRTGATPKYLYPAGVSVSRLMFGYRLAIRRNIAVLVEGAADAIAVDAALKYLDSSLDVGVYATYGCGLHRPQQSMLEYRAPKRVLMGFDMDDAGRRAAYRDYGLAISSSVVEWPCKDPGECTDEQIATAIEEAVYDRVHLRV